MRVSKARVLRALRQAETGMSGSNSTAAGGRMTYGSQEQRLSLESQASEGGDRKGKGRARDATMGGGTRHVNGSVGTATRAPLKSMLEEALNTPITHTSRPSIDLSYTPSSLSSHEHGLSSPPLAHHPSGFPRPQRPQLVSQLTRSTLPVSSLSYATAATAEAQGSSGRYRQPSISSQPEFELARSPHQRHASSSSRASSSTTREAFPDLDPTTGLPMSATGQRSDLDGNDHASTLHLQRTITSLLASPEHKDASSSRPVSSYLPSMPSLPSIPAMPNLSGLSLSIPGRSTSDAGRPRQEKRQLSTSLPSKKQEDGWGSSLGSWWNGSGAGGVSKGNEGMIADEDRQGSTEETEAKIKEKYRTPKNPVIFCHGLLGFDYLGPTSLPPLQISHWRGIREVLEANGVDVLITRVPATASVEDRAKILEEVISDKYPGRDVNLIGHSMGGLDCRYLTSQINPTKFNIVSVTTIATPHRGSPFADYLIDSVIGRERLPSILSMLEPFKIQNSGDGSAFDALSTRSMKDFNAQVLDRPDVKYMSWGAAFEPGLLDTFRWPHSVILAKEGPNDGLVSVQSAQWGEYRGTLLGVNHLDLVGWVNHVRYAFSNWSGNPISFKPATFYLEVSDYLAGQGY